MSNVSVIIESVFSYWVFLVYQTANCQRIIKYRGTDRIIFCELIEGVMLFNCIFHKACANPFNVASQAVLFFYFNFFA
ncbi:hypothetical protein EB241_14360 [Erwinia psidii]|uniref:Uncharacterized protein n=1 Tax=Erwinia psidii TaxID=69224 RepID=A0A3N6TQB4_9GAMM|nr:hypothetical protein EB241_14360 [Erwinia psidii]